MGKDLKGKELGVGISQREKGLYTKGFFRRITKNEIRNRWFTKCREEYII